MKKTILIMAMLMIAIQFYRPHKNIEITTSANDFLVHEKVPKNIVDIFKKSCYDCHSNHTEYTWYDNVAPLSWMLDKNIKRAKFSLNLSGWGTFEPWRRRLFLQGGIPYDISINKMPPPSYLFMHPSAELSMKEKREVEEWILTIDIKD